MYLPYLLVVTTGIFCVTKYNGIDKDKFNQQMSYIIYILNLFKIIQASNDGQRGTSSDLDPDLGRTKISKASEKVKQKATVSGAL
jgi:hypothetical protein